MVALKNFKYQKYHLIFLLVMFICIHLLFEKGAVNRTFYNIFSLSVLFYFFPFNIIKEIKELTIRIFFSHFLMSLCISIAIISTYILLNNFLKLVSIIMLLINYYFIYSYNENQNNLKYVHFLAIVILVLANYS